MPTKASYVYIPNVTFWHWERMTPAFLNVQRSAVMRSFAETELQLANLDADVDKIEQEMMGKWAEASVQVLWAFRDRLKTIQKERKRVESVRLKLRKVIDILNAHLEKE